MMRSVPMVPISRPFLEFLDKLRGEMNWASFADKYLVPKSTWHKWNAPNAELVAKLAVVCRICRKVLEHDGFTPEQMGLPETTCELIKQRSTSPLPKASSRCVLIMEFEEKPGQDRSVVLQKVVQATQCFAGTIKRLELCVGSIVIKLHVTDEQRDKLETAIHEGHFTSLGLVRWKVVRKARKRRYARIAKRYRSFNEKEGLPVPQIDERRIKTQAEVSTVDDPFKDHLLDDEREHSLDAGQFVFRYLKVAFLSDSNSTDLARLITLKLPDFFACDRVTILKWEEAESGHAIVDVFVGEDLFGDFERTAGFDGEVKLLIEQVHKSWNEENLGRLLGYSPNNQHNEHFPRTITRSLARFAQVSGEIRHFDILRVDTTESEHIGYLVVEGAELPVNYTGSVRDRFVAIAPFLIWALKRATKAETTGATSFWVRLANATRRFFRKR